MVSESAATSIAARMEGKLDFGNMGLEEISEIFAIGDATATSAEEIRDWMRALGEMIGKKRMVDSATAWARTATDTKGQGCETRGDFGEMTVEDFAVMDVPPADARALVRHLNGRWMRDQGMEQGDDCGVSGKTSTGSRSEKGSRSTTETDSSGEFAKQAAASIARVSRGAKLKNLTEVLGRRPRVGQLQAMAKDTVKKRRTANATLAALIREIGENPMRDDLKAVELVGRSELDDDLELCDAIVNAMSEQAIDEVQDASQSGVGLFWQLMQEAIGRPFEHVAEAIKSVCEDTEACKGEEYLEADFKWWEAAVQEIRYTQFVSYQIIVESLGKLLHKQGALMQRCYIQWQLGTTDKEHEHETFNKVLEVVREKIDIVRGKTK